MATTLFPHFRSPIMVRSLALAVLFLATLAAGLLFAQDEIRQGTIASVDVEKGELTIRTPDGREHECSVEESTRIMGADGQAVRERLKADGFKVGAAVMFKAGKADGKRTVLEGLRLGGGGPQPGKIVKIDAEKGELTIRTPDGKEHDVLVVEGTRIMGADQSPVKDRLKAPEFKADAAVMFKVGKTDGKRGILDGLKLGGPGGGGRPGGDPPEKFDTSVLKPLTELGSGKYGDFEGGLYPGGSNKRPADHEAAGIALAKTIEPRAADGKPDAAGKIVLLSIGMSNTSQEFSGFQQVARGERVLNPKLVLVNGAQGGMTAAAIQNPEDGNRGAQFWRTVDERLRQAGVSRQQVQAVWIKQADAGPNQGFPKYARTLQAEMQTIAHVLHQRFPNLKLAYLSSRIYAGYARTRLNPEPYAYESGFSVKWLIEQQLQGDPALNFDPNKGLVQSPWLSWGPYLWANGTRGRAGGLRYEESDLANDGTHPSPAGQRKVAEALLEFFKSDSTTKGWFTAGGQ
jgi:hypothetical protein